MNHIETIKPHARLVRRITGLLLAGILFSAPGAFADRQTVDAAIGGGVGGAIGGAVGSELGGREGAIIGAAAGAAIGAAVATEPEHEKPREREVIVIERDPHHGKFCPPGLAKQGRC